MRTSRTLSSHFALSPFALTFAATVATSASASTFDIPAGPLDQTLLSISQQSGKAISFEQSLIRGHTAPAIKGDLSSNQALQLALQGTGVQETEQGNDIVLSAAPSTTAETVQAGVESPSITP